MSMLNFYCNPNRFHHSEKASVFAFLSTFFPYLRNVCAADGYSSTSWSGTELKDAVLLLLIYSTDLQTESLNYQKLKSFEVIGF